MTVVLKNLCLPVEAVHHTQIQTHAFIENQDLGIGTLCIAENSLVWRRDDGKGFELMYPTISLHAISKDVSAFPNECIYLMVETTAENEALLERYGCECCFSMAEKLAHCKLQPENNAETNGHSVDARETEIVNGDTEAHESNVSEIRFVPIDKSSLEPMFQALSECQALHPDENDSFSGDDDYEHQDSVGEIFVGANPVEFDEYGQLVYRQNPGFRGADYNAEETVNAEQESDEEEMEVGQFDDAPNK